MDAMDEDDRQRIDKALHDWRQGDSARVETRWKAKNRSGEMAFALHNRTEFTGFGDPAQARWAALCWMRLPRKGCERGSLNRLIQGRDDDLQWIEGLAHARAFLITHCHRSVSVRSHPLEQAHDESGFFCNEVWFRIVVSPHTRDDLVSNPHTSTFDIAIVTHDVDQSLIPCIP